MQTERRLPPFDYAQGVPSEVEGRNAEPGTPRAQPFRQAGGLPKGGHAVPLFTPRTR